LKKAGRRRRRKNVWIGWSREFEIIWLGAKTFFAQARFFRRCLRFAALDDNRPEDIAAARGMPQAPLAFGALHQQRDGQLRQYYDGAEDYG